MSGVAEGCRVWGEVSMEGVGIGALDGVRIGALEGVGWGRSRMSLSGKLHGTLCISRTHLIRKRAREV